jgi:hypothetical protein
MTPRAAEDQQRASPLHSRLQRTLDLSQRPKEWGKAVSLTIALGVAILALARQLQLNDVVSAPPGLAMDANAPAGQAQVLRADTDLRWSELVLDGDCTPLINGSPFLEHVQDPVRAGDVVTCASGSNLQVSSAQKDGGVVLFEATFA